MKLLFDTNLWISFMIGRRLASLSDVLNRHEVGLKERIDPHNISIDNVAENKY